MLAYIDTHPTASIWQARETFMLLYKELSEAYKALDEMEMFSDDETGVVTVSTKGYADYERAFDAISRARSLIVLEKS